MPCFDAKLQANKTSEPEANVCHANVLYMVRGMHVGKKALLEQHFLALLQSQKLIWIFSILTSSKLESLESRDEIYQKYLEY